MNKILLNILIFVGFQQFILGAEANKEPETKLGFCLSCYLTNCTEHDIPSVFDEKFCKECVKQVYSVCSKGHTMCGKCIYDSITYGIDNMGGTINCFYCNIDPDKDFGKNKKKFQPCHEPISREIIEYILQNFATSEKKKELLEKYNRQVKELEYKRVLLHPENKACKYEGCRGFFDVTEKFFCNNDENHINCNICFEKKHKGKCKDPLLEYISAIEINRNVQKKIQNKQLNNEDIEGCKPCPNCHKLITKQGGCNHITCGCDYGANNWKDNGCGYQWCWRCGGAYTNSHYWYKGPCRQNPQLAGKNNEDYADDGNYFGIKNGKFEEQFKKLAREGVIDVIVDITVDGQYDGIKKIDWDKINKGKKDWMDNNPGKNYYNEYHNEYRNECCTECCTECCGYVFTFFQ